MYHQMLKIGEDSVLAEVEYTVGDPSEEMPVITKIRIGNADVPVGAFDWPQIEAMAGKLVDGHADVMRGLIDDARIDAWEANRAGMEACI